MGHERNIVIIRSPSTMEEEVFHAMAPYLLFEDEWQTGPKDPERIILWDDYTLDDRILGCAMVLVKDLQESHFEPIERLLVPGFPPVEVFRLRSDLLALIQAVYLLFPQAFAVGVNSHL